MANGSHNRKKGGNRAARPTGTRPKVQKNQAPVDKKWTMDQIIATTEPKLNEWRKRDNRAYKTEKEQFDMPCRKEPSSYSCPKNRF